tara:strand:- start:8983 stop:9828 length:846 start_codon:yes stop_codon:yes gene_type:complete
MKKNFKTINQNLKLLDSVISNHIEVTHILLKKYVIKNYYTYSTIDRLKFLKQQTNCYIKYLLENNVSEYQYSEKLDFLNKKIFQLVFSEEKSTIQYKKNLYQFEGFQKELLILISDYKSFILEYKNQHDQLTQIPLRYLMYRKIDTLFQKKENFFIGFIDIDNFKTINDKYGYDFGDYILKQVSSYLKEKIENSTLYRYGGEEFIVIIENNNIDTIKNNIKSLYNDIVKNEFNYKNKKTKITFSSAFKKYNHDLEDKKNIQLTSELMQKAKKEGKNKYYFF